MRRGSVSASEGRLTVQESRQHSGQHQRSAKSAMGSGSAEAWARLRLVQGQSSAQAWELVASRGQTTLTVGSGPEASWQVREDGVKPLHFSLHWDGSTLRIADLEQSGDVRVDASPVTAVWRALGAHARIDFGRAVIMVDTSTNSRSGESDHPLEPGSVPPSGSFGAEPASGAMPRLHKATLLGVAISDLPPPPAGTYGAAARLESVRPASSQPSGGQPSGGQPSASQPAASQPPEGMERSPTAGFRVVRPSDSERVRKATLIGAAISVPPPAPVPDPIKPSTPPRGLSTGTLMGVANPLDVKLSRLTPSGDGSGEVRTFIGMPMGDANLRNSIGTAPTQVDVPVPAQSPGERIASTWHEDAGSARPSLPPEPAIIAPSISDSGARAPLPGQLQPGAVRVDVARPKRSFPLQYVGIVMLTGAAYFAWLYLLDHW